MNNQLCYYSLNFPDGKCLLIRTTSLKRDNLIKKSEIGTTTTGLGYEKVGALKYYLRYIAEDKKTDAMTTVMYYQLEILESLLRSIQTDVDILVETKRLTKVMEEKRSIMYGKCLDILCTMHEVSKSRDDYFSALAKLNTHK